MFIPLLWWETLGRVSMFSPLWLRAFGTCSNAYTTPFPFACNASESCLRSRVCPMGTFGRSCVRRSEDCIIFLHPFCAKCGLTCKSRAQHVCAFVILMCEITVPYRFASNVVFILHNICLNTSLQLPLHNHKLYSCIVHAICILPLLAGAFSLFSFLFV